MTTWKVKSSSRYVPFYLYIPKMALGFEFCVMHVQIWRGQAGKLSIKLVCNEHKEFMNGMKYFCWSNEACHFILIYVICINAGIWISVAIFSSLIHHHFFLFLLSTCMCIQCFVKEQINREAKYRAMLLISWNDIVLGIRLYHIISGKITKESYVPSYWKRITNTSTPSYKTSL